MPELRLPFQTRTRFLAAIACCALSSLRGQVVLFAEHNGDMAQVREVRKQYPYVDDGKGGVAHASGRRLSLRVSPEYLPYTVWIDHISAGSMYQPNSAEGFSRFTYQADFKSPFALKHVFILLDMTTAQAGHAYLVWEVPDLEPYKSTQLKAEFEVRGEVGEGKYLTHVFVGGREVFNSTQDSMYIEEKLDEMAAARIANVVDAKPRPYIGPFPEITSQIRGKKGQAMIHCVINSKGRVVDATVKSATAPELGDAALGAARQWRFLPKVVSGGPVSSAITIPFDFPPQ